MWVLAKAVKGQEFLYNPRTAHAVSKTSSKRICDILNANGWKLEEKQVWHPYEVDRYDTAYGYAQYQRFTIRKGVVKRVGVFE